MDLLNAIYRTSFEEFLELYTPGMATSCVNKRGKTLLLEALLNNRYRTEICNYLLDDGADATVTILPEGYNCLHILMQMTLNKVYPENNATDLALMERLLDRGADINAVDRRDGTPLQVLTLRTINLSDRQIAVPFLDLVFSRDDLDLLRIAGWNKSTYDWLLMNWPDGIVMQYARRYLQDRHIELPDAPPPTH